MNEHKFLKVRSTTSISLNDEEKRFLRMVGAGKLSNGVQNLIRWATDEVMIHDNQRLREKLKHLASYHIRKTDSLDKFCMEIANKTNIVSDANNSTESVPIKKVKQKTMKELFEAHDKRK